MSARRPFHKSIGTFDRIEVKSIGDSSEWVDIVMHVGNDVQTVTMTLRSDEAVRDLHYAIGRYLDSIQAT